MEKDGAKKFVEAGNLYQDAEKDQRKLQAEEKRLRAAEKRVAGEFEAANGLKKQAVQEEFHGTSSPTTTGSHKSHHTKTYKRRQLALDNLLDDLAARGFFDED